MERCLPILRLDNNWVFLVPVQRTLCGECVLVLWTGTAAFDATGGKVLPHNGDSITMVMDYFASATTFQNAAPTVSMVSGVATVYDLTYQIDKTMARVERYFEGCDRGQTSPGNRESMPRAGLEAQDQARERQQYGGDSRGET